MAKLSKRVQEKMQQLALLFNSNTVVLSKHACTGKWSGTTDYSLLLDNNRELFICNGMKHFEEIIDDKIRIYSNFNANKEVILNKLKEVQKDDELLSSRLGMHECEVVDVDYCKSGTHIKWFYVTLKVNGKLIKHVTTGLCSYIEKLCNDLTLPITQVVRSTYFVAGGLKKADYIFAGVGFDSKDDLYCLM